MAYDYLQICNINCTIVGNKIADHSDVVWVSPVAAAPTISSFPTKYLVSLDWAQTTAGRDEKHSTLGFGAAYVRGLTLDVIA